MTERAREILRVTLSMTIACAAGAAILGGVFMATDRYAEASRKHSEQQAIGDLLGLDSTARVIEIRQYLADEPRAVIYRRMADAPGADALEVSFSLDGALLQQRSMADGDARSQAGLRPLGRIFVAWRGGAPAGFVVEGEARGYKNRIRFFVALDGAFDVAGVRVIEHEEDPGLGAEIATPWFEGQYRGRAVSDLRSLEVTRDPMPEDWRAALGSLHRIPPSEWKQRYGSIAEREERRPIYAVSGATISSEALTHGVRSTADHFRRRWTLIAPHLGDPS